MKNMIFHVFGDVTVQEQGSALNHDVSAFLDFVTPVKLKHIRRSIITGQLA